MSGGKGKTRKRERRINAVARQHDMRVSAYRARHDGYSYPVYAPVSEFLAPGETWCPGDHMPGECEE